MVLLNIILGVFNLIPVPPLDGSEVILLFFPESEAPVIRERMASVGIFGIFIAWALFRFISEPLVKFVIILLGG
jgi:Zn-dependent protease